MSLVLTFLGVWERKSVSVILPMGNYLRLWDTFSELERIQCRALYVSLEKPFGGYCNQCIYKTVLTSEEWLWIADEFNEICKMPNCVGSRDGKHCLIKCPPNAGFLYFNYKSFYSLNLLGVDDANCCFTLIDVGSHGRENDNSVFSNWSFGKAFSSGDLNVPPIRNIPVTSISIPLHFVGDEAFPLKPWKYSEYN